jgi:adenosine deaminase
MLDAGLSVSCSNDNRLMSDTTLCKELALIQDQAKVSLKEIIAMQYAGIEASFLPADVKAAAKAKVQAWEKAQA